eukprot:Partr_v1_DN20651_c0_g1_i1_m38014 putative NA
MMSKRKRTPTASSSSNIDDESVVSAVKKKANAEEVPLPGVAIEKYIDNMNQLLKRQMRDGKIACYSNGDMWIKPKLSPLGIAPGRFKLLPLPFYLPDICVWIPDMMHASVKVRCHRCRQSNSVTHSGWPNNPVARRVIGECQSYYIMTCQYHCSACNVRFLGHMPEVVKLLPPWVQSLFPAYLTHRSGLDKRVVRLMMSAFDEGFGPGPLAEYLRECHHEEYDYRRLRY